MNRLAQRDVLELDERRESPPAVTIEPIAQVRCDFAVVPIRTGRVLPNGADLSAVDDARDGVFVWFF